MTIRIPHASRGWKGCDYCKKNKPTQRFDGALGDTIYICGYCLKNKILKWKKESL